MKLEDLKEAVGELLEAYNVDSYIDAADEKSFAEEDFWITLSKTEQKVVRGVAQVAHHPKTHRAGLSFEDTVRLVARHIGVDPGEWPQYEAFEADYEGAIKFDPFVAKNYICAVVANGGNSAAIKLDHDGAACPAKWGAKTGRAAMGGGDRADWMSRLSKEEQLVLSKLRSKLLNKEIPKDSDFGEAVKEMADELGISHNRISFLATPESINAAKAKFASTLPGGLSEKKNRKRGFGEGEPPDEEIYKKREVVQEIDSETPEAAQALGDASKEQGEATQGVADAHTRGAEAAKQRQDASKAWKDAKITQVKAIDAAEKAAAEEAKAADAQKKAMDAAQKAADAVEKAQGEKDKYLDVAKQAAEQEQEAATVAQDAAKAEEEAAGEIAAAEEEAAKASTERSGLEDEFGDAVASDEEARQDAEEEAAKEEEEQAKAEEEADKDEKESDRNQADAERENDADVKAAEEEGEDEVESVTETLKAMVREVMMEGKWGDKSEPAPTPEQKLQAAGITADELKSMVLQTVMHGEEERDLEMIRVLKDMLGSLQSIEYHITPMKGAGSAHAQTAAKGWVNEGKNNQIFTNIPSLISEMRDAGLEQEADDHESFFKWALANSDLTMQEIKNEADAQIADLKKMLRKMSDHVTGKEDSLEKQKLRGEVPGHH